ncbi:MAG: hypothetical protein QOI13_2105 [Paraburkholderia sp.]|jgi:hypothetical protein|nr:hypothetical protein [Paraburkholderia sp.]
MRSAFQICAFPSLCAPAWLVAAAIFSLPAISQPALADSERKSVVLDTQTGIRDGQRGEILQSAPLARASIGSAKHGAAAGEAQQPAIIVSPYIALPVGASASLTELRTHPATGQ